MVCWGCGRGGWRDPGAVELGGALLFDEEGGRGDGLGEGAEASERGGIGLGGEEEGGEAWGLLSGWVWVRVSLVGLGSLRSF